MRQITKENNDINWLFPKATRYYTADRMFDELSERAEDLLSQAYGEQTTFTADDMIDAFMKGASEMNRNLGYHIDSEKQFKTFY